jgi:hypothetical protein
MAAPTPPPRPIAIAAVEMGYGHLRAAHALAAAAGVEVLRSDRPPLAMADDERRWRRARTLYEAISRGSQVPVLGRALRRLLDALTAIPHLYPYRDQSPPTLGVRLLDRLARGGLGDGLLGAVRRADATLITTFFAQAIAAARDWPRVVCVVTDSDINRVWAPRVPKATKIHYCVPSERALRRLRSFGVPAANLHLTGFPLPPSLLGGPELDVLRRNLAARLVRLDPERTFRESYRDELMHFLEPLAAEQEDVVPLLTFAVGGAGAQVGMARAFLPGLREPIRSRRLRVALVAGMRRTVAASFYRLLADNRLDAWLGDGIEVLCEDDFPRYLERFDRLLARTDILWTKPSELVFYGALGLPLVFAPPVGVHERLNRRWAIQRGAGLKQDTPSHAWQWLREWLADGTLAAAAWSGYVRLPKFGTYRILEVAAGLATQA